jgi:hypothetical protein
MRLLLGLVMMRSIVLAMVLLSQCWPWRDFDAESCW